MKKYILIFVFIGIVLGFVYASYNLEYADGTSTKGYRIEAKKAQVVVTEHADEEGNTVVNEVSITNNGNRDIFVPTKTQKEWELFKENKPASISPINRHGEMIWEWECTKGYCDSCRHYNESDSCKKEHIGDIIEDVCYDGEEARCVCTAI